MANFIADNADLQFYLDKWIDWSALHEMSELNPDDPEAPQSAQEAKEFWREILELIAEFAANEIAPHAAALDHEAVALVDGEVADFALVGLRERTRFDERNIRLELVGDGRHPRPLVFLYDVLLYDV